MTTTLAETIRRAAGVDGSPALVAGRPSDEGTWTSLAEALSDASIVGHWFAALREGSANGRSDVAGSYLASYLADVIATPLARAISGQRRGWRTESSTTWVRATSHGWFEGVAIDTSVLVLPDDPRADDADVEVMADVDELIAVSFAHLVDVLGLVFGAVRARAPYGLRGMWGSVADSIASDATWRAHVRGGDVPAAWRDAAPLLGALAAAAPVAVTSPTFDEVVSDGRSAHLTIRGTCCLYYKTQDPGVGDLDYCTSCPLGTDDERRLRQERWLEREPLRNDA